ncbi:MAG: porin family protein [Proteobacteria bacterium]|jgi:hypothetical protein|nr:porin family protein [Pseudomonadota bacterium]
MPTRTKHKPHYSRNQFHSLQAGLFTVLSGLGLQANADYFIGLDYMALESRVKSDLTYTTHYLNPIRIRTGYLGQSFGIEVDFLTTDDDNNTNLNYNFQSGPSTGVYFYMYRNWLYAKMGGIWSDTTLKNTVSNTSDTTTLFQATAAVGIKLDLTAQLSVNTDYTFAKGNADYQNVGLGTRSNLSVVTQGFALGLTYRF